VSGGDDAQYTPDFDEFCALAGQGNLVPVYREILGDLDTPVSAFMKIDEGGDAFPLESVEGGEKWARLQFPRQRSRPRTLVPGRGVVGRPAPGPVHDRAKRPIRSARCGRCSSAIVPSRCVVCRASPAGSSGISATTSARTFERVPSRARDDLGHPDLYLMLADTLVIFDNVAQTMKVSRMRRSSPARICARHTRGRGAADRRARRPLAGPGDPRSIGARCRSAAGALELSTARVRGRSSSAPRSTSAPAT
jgi:anthranilate/para-aminobenzoate synthase component I